MRPISNNPLRLSHLFSLCLAVHNYCTPHLLSFAHPRCVLVRRHSSLLRFSTHFPIALSCPKPSPYFSFDNRKPIGKLSKRTSRQQVANDELRWSYHGVEVLFTASGLWALVCGHRTMSNRTN
jgi:hypothetical protein